MRYLGLCWIIIGAAVAQQSGAIGGRPAQAQPQQQQQPQQGRPTRSGRPPQAPVREEFKPEDLGKVEGIVRDARTGEPLRKANVNLYPTDNRRGGDRRPVMASTDGEGKFRVTSVEPGQYRLAADKPGYVRGEYGARTTAGVFGNGTTLRVDKRQTVGELEIQLQRHAVVTGRITDEDGDPVQRANVTLLRSRYIQGKKQMLPLGNSSTNDLGEYRIFGVPAGRYLLAVSPTGGPDRGLSRSGEGESYVQTFYPGATEMTSASTVILSAGMEAQGMDIRLGRNRTYQVQGRVTGMPAEVRGGSVMLVPVDGGFMMPWMGGGRTGWSGETGQFEVRGVSPGSYYLRAEGFVQPRTRLIGMTTIEVAGRDVEGVSIALGPLGTVKGQIRVEGTSSLPSMSGVNVFLEPKSGGVAMFGNSSGRAAEDGLFEVNEVSPMPAMLRVSNLPQGYYVQSIRMAEVDVLDHGIDLVAARSASNIDIILKEGAGNIDGTVQNEKGEPVSGAVVALRSTLQGPFATQLFKQVTTDQSGAFQIADIRPGEYKLLAFDKVDLMAVQDPELWAQYENSSVTLKIAEKAQESRTLKAVVASEQFSQ